MPNATQQSVLPIDVDIRIKIEDKAKSVVSASQITTGV
ncbi:hypothetical protein DSM25559_4221 [Agrobacterium rosae]|uniref:Uncharacterized protein n=1 Tax=Agrobacterium rosae TaxID=1972867 RepID=A0A1R3U1W8_9HYPH|nr:hypothetical protein DSM25559_4221 [Agrobacterium rosae]